jgi:hypothetical protein
MRAAMLKSSLCGVLLAALASAAPAAMAGAEAKVYPVRGVFWDSGETKAIDQRFMRSLDMPKLSLQVKDALDAAFAGRTGELTQKTGASTFAVSFHLTRMATYTARKPDGNVEIRTPITGSIYFTNVLTGEIVFTATSTNAALALVSGQALNEAQLRVEADKLYTASLSALIAQLCQKANAGFQPRALETKVTALHNGMLLLAGGYQQGFQSGDSLEDDQSNLIRVVYAGAGYAVAQPVLADDVKPGASFHKYVVGKIDGRLRPRATVVVDQVAPGFSSEYVAQLFAEELGQQAPLTMVQVNRNFAALLKAIAQQASLSTASTAQRDTPDLLIRLRVADPIMYEAKTNLAFRTVRSFEANAYAEIIDTTGRVLFTSAGHERQKIEVNNGYDLDPAARREIAIKNVLLNLAQQMGTLAEAKADVTPVARTGADGIFLSTPAKVYAQQANGYLLRQTEFKINGKSVKLLFPLSEAVAAQRVGAETRVAALIPFGKDRTAPAAGDVFEVLQLGTAPKSPAAFGLCPDGESLGSIRTPEFENIASMALAKAMPGHYYAPEVKAIADAAINGGTGFREAIKWTIPQLSTCLQPVQRVDLTGEECSEQCQKSVTARYTLRIKDNAGVGARVGLESKFKTSGYEKSTAAAAVASLVQSDLIDEAQKLLGSIAAKIVFPTTSNQER